MAEATIAGKGTGDHLGTGRRKSSVARVRIRPGDGQILINKRPLNEFFRNEQQREAVLAPLKATEKQSDVNILIRVHGGGLTGQADACKLGIARALKVMDQELEE
jgi:small subunit ribosomal protein S9